MELICIGKISKPHGTRGALKVAVEEKYIDDLLRARVVFIEISGSRAPYFVESVEENNFVVLQIEGHASRNAAEKFAQRPLYLRRNDLRLSDAQINAPTGQLLRYLHVTGFAMYDSTTGKEVGIISEVRAFPQQEMAEVARAEKSMPLLIPLVDGWIEQVDEANKRLLIRLPEGMTEL